MFDFLKRIFGGEKSAGSKTEAAPAPATEPIDRQDTADRIEILARGGFETPDSTLEIITQEYLVPDEIGPEDWLWIEAEVESAFDRKHAEEAAWPEATDHDRLVDAFESLDESGIIALHRAGNTRSDGMSDAAEIHHQRGGTARGYVFYQGQDVDRAATGGGLYLAYGIFDEDEARMRALAQEIVSALEKTGLAVEWSGDPDTRIFLPSLNWQKRSPR